MTRKNEDVYVRDGVIIKSTIIVNLINTGTSEFLPHIVQYCRVSAEKNYNWVPPVVLYCSGIMYKYYSCLGFLTIKNNEEGKNIHE